MAANRRHQVLNNQTITANGNSGMLPNLGESMNPAVVGYLDVTGAVTNGGGNLTVTVYGSSDGIRFAVLQAFTAVTATLANPQRIEINDVLEPFIYVEWVLTGTSPSYAGVNIDLYFTSPDA